MHLKFRNNDVLDDWLAIALRQIRAVHVTQTAGTATRGYAWDRWINSAFAGLPFGDAIIGGVSLVAFQRLFRQRLTDLSFAVRCRVQVARNFVGFDVSRLRHAGEHEEGEDEQLFHKEDLSVVKRVEEILDIDILLLACVAVGYFGSGPLTSSPP